MIHVLAASMPHLASDLRFLDSVSTEWRLYQADADISPDWAVTHQNQIKSFNVYKAAHSQYTQCDKIQRFHVCAVETKSIKANTNNVQLCKTNFAVAGQQI